MRPDSYLVGPTFCLFVFLRNCEQQTEYATGGQLDQSALRTAKVLSGGDVCAPVERRVESDFLV
jgi:hypothetical protein